MKRRTFDTLMTGAGLVVTIVLVVAGGLLLVGHNFADDNVTKQLSEQKITFPEKGSDSLKDSRVAPYLNKYAGQALTTGAQAQAYADHYIKVHIADLGKGTAHEGMTYAELGKYSSGVKAKIKALSPTDPAVAGLEKEVEEVATQRDTVFKGETLRGLLLNAYAWWKMGQIALWAAWGAFAAAAVLGILTIVGFWHLRRVSPEQEMFSPRIVGERLAS